ncbi:hypothetical protein [Streptomyces sp. NPDC127190]
MPSRPRVGSPSLRPGFAASGDPEVRDSVRINFHHITTGAGR